MITGFAALLTDYVNNLVYTAGYFGIFLAALLETVFPPIPSELVIPTAGYLAYTLGLGYIGLVGMILSGTLGATVGATIIYFMARKAGRFFVIKYGRYMLISESKLAAAEKWFDKYGAKAVFLGRMAPGIRELVSVPAGLSKMNLKRFLVYTFAGSLVWTTILATIGYVLGEAWQGIEISSITNVLAVLIILSIASYFVFRVLVKKKR
ncbi:DedA family protein [archaeon]|nr:MAG: DedA family protein [archaeon]